jgi:hypothetical protein
MREYIGLAIVLAIVAVAMFHHSSPSQPLPISDIQQYNTECLANADTGCNLIRR